MYLYHLTDTQVLDSSLVYIKQTLNYLTLNDLTSFLKSIIYQSCVSLLSATIINPKTDNLRLVKYSECDPSFDSLMILNLKSVLLSVKELVGVYTAALERELKACYEIGMPSLDLRKIDQGFSRR